MDDGLCMAFEEGVLEGQSPHAFGGKKVRGGGTAGEVADLADDFR